MSDKTKDYTKSNKMDVAEATALRMVLMEKENLELKQQLLQGNVDRAQLQAQLQGDKIKDALDKAQKNLEGLIASANSKYSIDLSKDKIDLTTGVITRAEVVEKVEEEEDND